MERPHPPPTSGRSSPSRGVKEGERTFDVDAVEKAQSTDVDDETLQELYGKEHVNIVCLDIWTSGRNLSSSSPPHYLHPPSNISPCPCSILPILYVSFFFPLRPFLPVVLPPLFLPFSRDCTLTLRHKKIFMGHVDAGEVNSGRRHPLRHGHGGPTDARQIQAGGQGDGA